METDGTHQVGLRLDHFTPSVLVQNILVWSHITAGSHAIQTGPASPVCWFPNLAGVIFSEVGAKETT